MGGQTVDRHHEPRKPGLPPGGCADRGTIHGRSKAQPAQAPSFPSSLLLHDRGTYVMDGTCRLIDNNFVSPPGHYPSPRRPSSTAVPLVTSHGNASQGPRGAPSTRQRTTAAALGGCGPDCPPFFPDLDVSSGVAPPNGQRSCYRGMETVVTTKFLPTSKGEEADSRLLQTLPWRPCLSRRNIVSLYS